LIINNNNINNKAKSLFVRAKNLVVCEFVRKNLFVGEFVRKNLLLGEFVR
jgi:hypothetical protein